MSGLDKIVEQINVEALAEADRIVKEANEYCESYMDEVEKSVGLLVEDINKKSLAERNLYTEKTHSGADFRERNQLLMAKQQCINEVVEKAKNQIANLPTDEYFNMLEKILTSNVQSAEGKMFLSKKDLDRLTDSFKSAVNEIALKAGGKLTIEDNPASIKDGFILVYGDIEENCTVKALFDANIDRIKDIASKKMFG